MKFWAVPDLFGLRARQWRGLKVLAYHRIGDRRATHFDPGVITVTQERLAQQIAYFKTCHRVVGLEEALEIAAGRQVSPGQAILLTFDDGYRDNYDLGLPVLQSMGVEAVFFLVTGFLRGESTPWWDRIAWLVRNSAERRYALPIGGATAVVDLRDARADEAIDRVLQLYKVCPATDASRFVAVLEAAAPGEAPSAPLLLGPDEARALVAAGMTVAAHTHTHPVLARLDPEAQAREMMQSRLILQRETGSSVDVLAYPVGGRRDFTRATQDLARECGFRAAFSCHGGLNRPGRSDLFDLKRIPVYWDARSDRLLDG